MAPVRQAAVAADTVEEEDEEEEEDDDARGTSSQAQSAGPPTRPAVPAVRPSQAKPAATSKLAALDVALPRHDRKGDASAVESPSKPAAVTKMPAAMAAPKPVLRPTHADDHEDDDEDADEDDDDEEELAPPPVPAAKAKAPPKPLPHTSATTRPVTSFAARGAPYAVAAALPSRHDDDDDDDDDEDDEDEDDDEAEALPAPKAAPVARPAPKPAPVVAPAAASVPQKKVLSKPVGGAAVNELASDGTAGRSGSSRPRTAD
jgi:hypothetical protein